VSNVPIILVDASGCNLITLLLSSRSEYTDQLLADIASYYGYNDFLAEKLFQLFPVAEVGYIRLNLYAPGSNRYDRPSNFSKPMRFLVQ
jgi:hypothetical protein